MKRRPLKSYRAPNYPRRGEDADAALRHLPERWKTKSKVAGAMALLFFPLPASVARAETPAALAQAAPVSEDKSKQKKPARLTTVFEHGEGRGAFGCVAVAPPAFLTEADARQVIIEEFKKVGVKFELDSKKIELAHERSNGMPFETRREPDGQVAYTPHGESTNPSPLTLDGYDSTRRIGFEFVSEGDYLHLGGKKSASTVQFYDFKKVAQDLQEKLAADTADHIAVFYDPMAKRARDAKWNAPNDRGREELRAQVRDFIAWLKANKLL